MKNYLHLLPRLGKEFKTLLAHVARNHKLRVPKTGYHHDLGHTLRVANTALTIAPDAKTARLAWVAAIIHNTDRLFGKRETPRKLQSYLAKASLTAKEKEIVFTAVVNHDKINDPKDDPIAKTLKDADRIADFGAIGLIRIGQYAYDKPSFDLVSPLIPKKGSRFGKEATAVEDLIYCLEWVEKPIVKIRLPKSKKVSKAGADFMRKGLKDILRQLKSIGMHPLPGTYKDIF